MTRLLIILMLGLTPDSISDWQEAAAMLVGAAGIEELSEDEMDRYETLHDRPLDINNASRGALEASGLFSDYQLRSLTEYIRTSGDILSWTELALVNGFDSRRAEALRHFIVLESRRAPGQTERRGVKQKLSLRSWERSESGAQRGGAASGSNAAASGSNAGGGGSDLKGGAASGSNAWAGGIRYEAAFGERAELFWSSRTSYADPRPQIGTVSAAYYGRRALGKVVAGHFAARFGQGLAQWSGFSLSGFGSISAFRKDGNGLAPTGSFSPSLLGAGADWHLRGWTFTAAAGTPASLKKRELQPIFHVSHSGRRTTLGATVNGTVAAQGSSLTMAADILTSLPDVSIFGEAACRTDGAKTGGAAVAGAVWTPGYGTKAAVQARWYSPAYRKTYSGLAAGFENSRLTVTADAACNTATDARQYKALLKLTPTFRLADTLSMMPALKAQLRYRPQDGAPLRADLRCDLRLQLGPWSLTGRADAVWCRSYSWLWYLEGGRQNDAGSAYLRFTLFGIDNWDDRIYVYERDAPGSFNVPSYYGRGYSVSATGSIKRIRRRWKKDALYARASFISYPWNLSPKPSRLELKLQYTRDL